MPAQSMYLTRLDFYSDGEGGGVNQWQDYINTREVHAGSGFGNYLGLVGIVPYVMQTEEETLIDSAEYANEVIRLHRYYRYSNEEYQACFVYLTTTAMPTLIGFTCTKGLIEWGWGNGNFHIYVRDTANEIIGQFYLEDWLLTEGDVIAGEIEITYVDREAGSYLIWNGSGYDEFFYDGGIQPIMDIEIYCDAGIQS